MKYQYAFTGECLKCHKKMWERDKSYSEYLFGQVLCAEHIPDHDLTGASTKMIKKV